MLKRLRVTIEQKEETDKILLWEMGVLDDNLKMRKFNIITVSKNDGSTKTLYNVEFITRLKKEKAISQITSLFIRKEFKMFNIISIY